MHARIRLQDFEDCKENISTLKKGREISVLKTRDDEREDTRLQLLDDIARKHDDPLLPHLKYLDFCLQAYKVPHASLAGALETAVRAFRNNVRYQNDPRYLALWLRVAHEQPDPVLVFQYLESKKIGLANAAYYLEYAACLESARHFDTARKILNLGMQRGAAPAESLKDALLALDANSDEHGADPDDASRKQRVLEPSNTFARTHAPQKPNKQVRNTTRIAVFKDTGDDVHQPSASFHPDFSIDAREAVKENMQSAGDEWCGSTRPILAGSVVSASKERISVFRDDSEAALGEASGTIVTAAKVPRQGDKLGPAKAVVSVTASDQLEEPKPHRTATIPGLLAGQQIMADLDACFSQDSEVSFEEVRAAQKRYTTLGKHVYKARCDPIGTPKSSRTIQFASTGASAAAQYASPTINTKAAMADIFDMFNNGASNAAMAAEDQYSLSANDGKSVLYQPEDDETISRQVYQREEDVPGKMAVFRDGGDELDLSKSICSRDVHGESGVVKGMAAMGMRERTSVYSTVGSSTPSSSLHSRQKTASTVVMGQHLSTMTPITEHSYSTSYADRSSTDMARLTGLSTIARVDRQSLSMMHEDEMPFDDTMARFAPKGGMRKIPPHELGIDESILFDEQNEEYADDEDQDDGQEEQDDVYSQLLDTQRPHATAMCDPTDPRLKFNIMKRAMSMFAASGEIEQSRLHLKLATAFPNDNGHVFKRGACVVLGDEDAEPLRVLATCATETDDENANDDDGCRVYMVCGTSDIEQTCPLALKVQTPPSAWEYYILYMLHSRLEKTHDISGCVERSFPQISACHIFSNVAMTLSLWSTYAQGSLLDLVNRASHSANRHVFGPQSSESGGVDELLAVFFTLRLVEAVSSMHECGMVHADIKAGKYSFNLDTVMVRYQDSEDVWDSEYRRNGQDGWKNHGVYLLDYSSSIDMRAFAPGQEFQMAAVECPDAALDCPQWVAGTPFTVQPDWYAVAGVAHMLLFGKWLEIYAGNDGRVMLKGALRSSWGDEWAIVFDMLLNGSGNGVADLLAKRLESECSGQETGKSLRAMLRSVEASRFN